MELERCQQSDVKNVVRLDYINWIDSLIFLIMCYDLLIIWILKIAQIWPMGVPSSYLQCAFDIRRNILICSSVSLFLKKKIIVN